LTAHLTASDWSASEADTVDPRQGQRRTRQALRHSSKVVCAPVGV
jgi:hypothetical protein